MSVVGNTEEALIRAIEELRHGLEAIEGVVIKLARGESVETIPPVKEYVDQPWVCAACGARLGIYDQEADTMRIRYKDFYFQAHLGPGGWMSTPCRSCGFQNRVADASEPPK